jgi:hypothetical protein
MFTGSAVRVQAVQDLKLQEGQEIGWRSWEGSRQHPRSPAEARKGERREQEENPKKTPKSQKPRFTSLALSLLVLFYLSLLLYRCLKLFIYYNYNFISLFLVAGGFELRTLQDNTPHYQSDGPQFESNKLYLLNYKISHLLQLKYSYIV